MNANGRQPVPTSGQPLQMRGAPAHHLPNAERYAVKHERIAVAGVADLRIRSLLDRQQFADPLGEAERLGISSAAWPLFGLLWPSGMRLAELMGERAVVQGERILEIGCGLGLASLVCQRAGADITASDCHPMARNFMRHNLRLNGLAPLPYRHGHWTDLLHGPAPHAPSGHKCVAGQFDLIIGADVLYERDDAGSLAAFIGSHCAERAEVWLIDPQRGNRPPFHRRMAALGFALMEQNVDRAETALSAAYRGRWLRYGRVAGGWVDHAKR